MTLYRCPACGHEIEVISPTARVWHGSCIRAKRPQMIVVAEAEQ